MANNSNVSGQELIINILHCMINITLTTFQLGGVLTISQINAIFFGKCSFKDNQAENVGAIYMHLIAK